MSKPSTYADLKQQLIKTRSELESARRNICELLEAARISSVEHGIALEQADKDREQLQADIRNQRALLDAVIEHLPVGIGIAEVPSGRWLRINQRSREIWGLGGMEATDASGHGKYCGFHPDGRRYSSEDWQLVRALKGEVIRGEEVLLIRGDGSRRVMRSNAGPVKDSEGRIVAAVVVIDDITDRKKAEQEADAERNRLKMAQEAAGMITWEWDIPAGSIRYFYDLSRIVHGQAIDAYCSLDKLFQEIHPEDRERLAQTLHLAAKEGVPWQCEYRVFMLDGTYHWILGRGKTVLMEDERPVRMLGVSTDITELKEFEEKLRRSEALYRAIGESIDYGVWVCAPDGRNVYASESFLKLVGLTQQQCSDFGWGDVLHPDDAQRTIAAWKDCVRTEGVWDIEHRYRGVDGRWHPILARGVPVRDEKGQITCWAGINLDIAKLKEAQDALSQAKEELDQQVRDRTAELSQTVETMAAEVAQRIVAEQKLRDRTEQLRSLTSELAMAEQRERMRLAQILHDGLQQILVAAKYRLATATRGQNIQDSIAETSDLLDDAIQTSRSLTSELSPPILREGGLVPALEWLVRWMREKHGLNVGLTVREDVNLESEQIVLLLFQAARELLFNVVKHAFTKAANLELSQSEGQIEIVVNDDGVGFDSTQIRGERGASGGFGLFSIRERVSFLGGRLEIQSQPGRGSRFKLSIPLSTAAMDSDLSTELKTQISTEISSRYQLKTSGVADSVRIVLVDDHMVMRQGLAGLLRSEPDFEVVGEASDGASAVKLVRELHPHVVLMDVSMPGMNGIDSTKIIHREMPAIRIIGLSMFEEGEQATAMRDAGAAAYLTKSGPSEALIGAIRKCIRDLGRVKDN